MQKLSFRLFILLVGYILFFSISLPAQNELKERLLDYLEGEEIETLESTHYPEKYTVYITQSIDHKDNSAGTFKQRITICHAGFDKPTVFVTEGYNAAYASRAGYRDELSELFDANVIVVEHRYFGKSVPDVESWDFLTAENSAYDLNHVNLFFKNIYPGKWISTGISKGGQTTALYRAYFPDDVDVSVPYVAPLNKAVEDSRHISFLKKTGTRAERKKILNFQKEILKRKQEILPLLDEYSKKAQLSYRLSLNQILDYCVLEYPFALWQWGTSVSTIPSLKADTETLFDHLLSISGPEYFSENQVFGPFFVQAARELGYYPYDTRPLAKYLTISSAEGYLQALMLPDGVGEIAYSDALYQKIYNYLEQNDPKMIFIYGENDPWSATRVPDFKNKENLQIYIERGGSHRARIGTMPKPVQEKIIQQINKWLED